MTDASPVFTAQDFRQVLGHYPSGVCVITARTPLGELTGMAVSSFTSVSLDPPLVAFFPAKTSSSWPKIAEAGHFCVNILAQNQRALCRQFATSGHDKYGLHFTDLLQRRTDLGRYRGAYRMPCARCD